MALSEKLNMLVTRFNRRPQPIQNDDVRPYLAEELREIEASIRALVDAAVQVADRAPENPRKGMVRYAVSPWNPLGDGSTGLVVYNGTAWVAV